jgi:uncharacterized protein (TIGR00161 family)
MDNISIIEYKEVDLSNSMLVVAFPTVGLISSIAGHFIIDSLKLEPIGTITSNQFMPATVIHKSIPSPPVRIYGGKKKCGPNDICNTLAIIISEFMPSPEIIKPLVEKILNWAEKKGCRIILSLEGMHAIGKPTKKSKIFGIATTPEMVKTLKNFKINQTQEGMITGVTGVLLYQGLLDKKDVICLLAETQANYPDSRAAAVLIEKLDKMLPAIKIDPKPLYNTAKKIEDKILKSLEQSKPTAPSIQPAPFSMYR